MEIRGSLQAEFVETSAAKEALLFSNTASFLLERLRKDSSASYLAHNLKTEEIVDLLEDLCKAPPANLLDLLWVYAALAALSLKDDLPKFKNRLNSIDLSHVQWGDEILRTITEDHTTTSFQRIQYYAIGNDAPEKAATKVTTGTALVRGVE